MNLRTIVTGTIIMVNIFFFEANAQQVRCSPSDKIKMINYIIANSSSFGVHMALSEARDRDVEMVLSYIRSNPKIFKEKIEYFSEVINEDIRFIDSGARNTLNQENEIDELLGFLLSYSILADVADSAKRSLNCNL